MTIIDCVSDLHGHYPELSEGDILIIAGDCTASDRLTEWAEFFVWLKKQSYVKKILIGGNHDNFLMCGFPKNQTEADELKEVQSFLEEQKEMDDPDFEYLCDSGTQFCGMEKDGNPRTTKIWGSPWSSQFPGINPKCCAFTRPFMVSLKDRWDLIPDDVDILITHTPPFGILDRVEREYNAHCGDLDLLKALEDRINPKLHCFGHIHSDGGKQIIYKRPGYGDENNTICVNASVVDERYRHVNKPIRIKL